MEKERTLGQLKSFVGKGVTLDSKFEEILSEHLDQIEDLKDKLSKTEVKPRGGIL